MNSSNLNGSLYSKNKKSWVALAARSFLATMATLLAQSTIHASEQIMYATPNNLSKFELYTPQLNGEEQADVEAAIALEADPQAQLELFAEAVEEGSLYDVQGPSAGEVKVEIYQNAKTVGKQFLVVRQNGSIRYVFAASAGASGRSTPGGTFGILKQRWRHMSQTYPGRGENNMDHVSYFRPVIGFHSTVFGLYSKLGRRDSHGCVRMGRPEARATFRLIKHSAKTTVVSYQSGEPSSRDLPLIKEMLARDFNLIQAMLATGNKGDVPFTWEEYDQYVRGDLPWSQAELERRLRQKGIKEIIEIRSNQDLGPHAPSPSLRSI